MGAGALMKLLAAVVQIDASDASNSYINFGNAFNVSKDADGNLALAINSPTDNAIMVNNKPVWHKGNMVIQQDQPPSGRGLLWLKPTSVSTVNYLKSVTSTGHFMADNTQSHALAAQGSDVMSAAGTYTFTIRFRVKHYGGGSSIAVSANALTVALIKSDVTVNMSYATAFTLKAWGEKEVTITATSTSTVFSANTDAITCNIQISGLGAYSQDRFLGLASGSVIDLQINGPGTGGSAQLCEVKYVP